VIVTANASRCPARCARARSKLEQEVAEEARLRVVAEQERAEEARQRAALEDQLRRLREPGGA